ncbi:unnamed protein product [Allacma fusca]|uniref:Uncharacterized protein n=1 Tax=Allacma fusca TaxID=39272 RepID=A0A8J2LRF1_9HEXA|nr:unnamed protein product [Allacma fusca]
MSTELVKAQRERKKKAETNDLEIDQIESAELLETTIKPSEIHENRANSENAKPFESIYLSDLQDEQCVLDGIRDKNSLITANQTEPFATADEVFNDVKGETDALEKCIEWLSYHPTEELNSPGYKEQTRREIHEYRQNAVRHWVNQIPEESESDEDEKSSTKDNGESQLELFKETMEFTVTAETAEEDNGLVSNYILSKLPSINRDCERTKSWKKYEDERESTNKDPLSNACSWLIRHVIGKCWKKHINVPPNLVVNKDAEEKTENKDLDVVTSCGKLEDGNILELSSGEVFSQAHTSKDTSGRDTATRAHTDSNSDEILRLTSLLQNTPKSTMRMRSIFSLRKERIAPEKQKPPSVFIRVGKQMRGFITNRLGIGSINQNRGNRSNRINPYNHTRVTTTTQPQLQPQPEESSQNSNWQRILNVLFSDKSSSNITPTTHNATTNPTYN